MEIHLKTSQKNCKVLLYERQAIVAHDIKMTLKKENCEVARINENHDFEKSEKPDFIITEIGNSSINDLQKLRILNYSSKHKIPVILILNSFEISLDLLPRLKVIGKITKPFNSNEIVNLLFQSFYKTNNN